MFDVFIADDEPFVIEGLEIMIDWERLGLRVIGSANDGTAAFEQIKRLEPDIVISDIRMPGMDGCGLIERCAAELKRKPKFIMLSGYSEFDYVKRTMRHGAKHYLLKPIDPEEMTATLEEVLGEIAEDIVREDENERLLRCVEEEVFRKLLLCGGDEKTTERARFLLDVKSQESPLSMVMFRMNTNMSLKDIDEFAAALRKSAEKMNMLALYIGMRVVAAIGARRAIPALRRLAAEGENCCDSINICNVEGMDELKRAYRHIVTNVCGSAGEIKIVEPDKRIERLVTADTDAEHIVSLLLKNEYAVAEETVMNDFETMRRDKTPLAFARGYISAVLLSMYRYSDEMGINLEEIYNEAVRQLERSSDYERLEIICIDMMNNFTASIRNMNVTDDIVCANDILGYIEEHYAEHITLNDISNAVYIQPGTVSKIIKKRTGMKFSDYLACVRIRHAQLLMANTNRKITQIAADVGYSYYYYFANRFKSVTGYNPSDYRKQALKKWGGGK